MTTEQRQSARKILKVKGVLGLDGQPPMRVRTADIAANGVSVSVQEPMQPGQVGHIQFDLLIEGKPAPVAARVKAMYCIFSGGEFKVGFQFLNLDLGTMTQLSRFLR